MQIDVDDDWQPNERKLEIVAVEAGDEKFMNELKKVDKDMELYDPIKDMKYEKWVKNKFGKARNVLSCPKCFTEICYEADIDDGNFIAKKTVGTVVGNSYQKTKDNEMFLTVDCQVCDCTLGVLDPTSHTYHLFHVLESTVSL